MPLKLSQFKKLSHKLIVQYLFIFSLVAVLAFGVVYVPLRSSILQTVDDTLLMQIQFIKNSIEASSRSSIRAFYRATTHTAENLIGNIYRQFEGGQISEAQAQDLVWSYLQDFTMGESGYFVVLDRNGTVVYHPSSELVGQDPYEYSFTTQILENDETFFDYEWSEPETGERAAKLMYSLRTPYWGWYIGVTGYRDELLSLISIEDFEDDILSINFGETGYPVIIDYEGTLLIHPEYKGQNMVDRDDGMGEVTRTSLRERNGKISYMWQNPGEKDYRKKITVYADLPMYEMLVAATAYESEFMKPLNTLKTVLSVTLLLSLGIISFLTIKISNSITKPISGLLEKMDQASAGDLSVRSEISSEDEIGEIEVHFNDFLSRLEKNYVDLQKAHQELIEVERFANMGRLVARVAHHLNTPLGVAMTSVSVLENEAQDFATGFTCKSLTNTQVESHSTTIIEVAKLLQESLDKTIGLIDSFKLLKIDTDMGEQTELDLYSFLYVNYLDQWNLKKSKPISLSIRCEEGLLCKTYPGILLLVLNHLTDNSLKHSFKDLDIGTISITVESLDTGVEIVYSDSGRGISQEKADRIFEPFFSDNHQFQDAGIGLNIVYNAVTGNLRGSIRYIGNEDSGMKYRIVI